jgi:hypothetical protein
MPELSLLRRERVRAANEEIIHHAESIEFIGRVPLPCECGVLECKGVARIETDAFRIVVTQPTWFIEGAAHGARYIVVDADTGAEVARASVRMS